MRVSCVSVPNVGHGIDKSPIVCVGCGVVVDRLRDPARIASGRIVHVCRACAGLNANDGRGSARASSQSACARCGSEVALYEARPVAGAGGRIALACAGCAEGQADLQGQPGAIPDALPSSPSFSAGRRQPATLVALAVAVLLAGLYLRGQAPPRSAAAGSTYAATYSLAGSLVGGPLAGQQPRGGAPASAGVGDALLGGASGVEGPAESSPEGFGDHELDDHEHGWLEDIDRSLIDRDGELRPTIEDMRERSEPLEERLPTLADWVFPVQGSDEPFPLRPTRRFGAGRDGEAPTECGRGHCGVDLDGPRGTPVVAVAWGVVTRIERRGDRRSGKYVRIEHPDYVYTAYMHLDDIADDLQIGDEVSPGDALGTLGRTGIKHSAPHLHFSLAVPSGNQLVHLDPAPYLDRAERLPAR
jgi:murein DD-endopeptidase MepM/ murein hydrolase activator NlpD